MIKSKNLTSIKKNALKLLKDIGLNPETIDLKNNLAVDINKIADCLDIKIKYHSFSNDISGSFIIKTIPFILV